MAHRMSTAIYVLVERTTAPRSAPRPAPACALEIRDVTSSHEKTTDVNGFIESVTEEALAQMQYLHAALSETMRLYPPVPEVK